MDPPVGFWQITPSSEFRSGGPLKQNLTSHVGPYALAVSILLQKILTKNNKISYSINDRHLYTSINFYDRI